MNKEEAKVEAKELWQFMAATNKDFQEQRKRIMHLNDETGIEMQDMHAGNREIETQQNLSL